MSIIRTLIQRFLIIWIRAYQLSFSYFFGNRCRFLPTCSDYTCDAIRHHGPIKGVQMGMKRLLRCHPFGGMGADPPVNKTGRK